MLLVLFGNELTESLPNVYTNVREKLDLPENIMLITLLLLGYPESDAQKPPKIRKSVEQVISYEKYRNTK